MSKWEWKKLGEVYDFTRGLTYSKKDEVESSSNCILRSNNIDLQTNSINLDELKYIKDEIDIPQEKYVHKNTILICMSNGSKAHLGKVAYIDKDYDFAFGGFMGLLKPKCEINGKFVHLYLCSDEYKNFIKSLSDGANINNLKFDDLRKFEIPFPPLSEQNRIVKFLDEEFSKIETLKTNAETNLKKAGAIFDAELKKEFNKKKWDSKKLNDLCELISGYAFDSKGYSSKNEDTLLVCGDNIMHCSFRWETVKRWPKEKCYELKRFELKDSDIVLAMDRPWIKSGLKISKITGNELPSLLVQRTAALRTTSHVSSDYLYYALQEKNFSDYLIDQQTGSGVPHISGKQILNFQIPLPPLSVQKEIVARLDKLSENVKRLEANYKQIIADCDELKKSILKKTFEGES